MARLMVVAWGPLSRVKKPRGVLRVRQWSLAHRCRPAMSVWRQSRPRKTRASREAYG